MKFLFSFLLSAITLFSFSQTGDEINQSNPKGLKVGKWIKKYQNGKIQYEGTFNEGIPTGEFRRYSEKGKLEPTLLYTNKGKTAAAHLYRENGKILASGLYST